jgi:hypothetical protein
MIVPTSVEYHLEPVSVEPHRGWGLIGLGMAHDTRRIQAHSASMRLQRFTRQDSQRRMLRTDRGSPTGDAQPQFEATQRFAHALSRSKLGEFDGDFDSSNFFRV